MYCSLAQRLQCAYTHVCLLSSTILYTFAFQIQYNNHTTVKKGRAYVSGPQHIKFSLCVRLKRYLKETVCVRSDVYSYLSQKITIVIVIDDFIAAYYY